MRPKNPSTSSINQGFSLLEVLVAIAVLSIAGKYLIDFSMTSMKANKSVEIRADLQDIKRMITNRISCDMTLGAEKPSPCSGPVEIKDKNGTSLAPGGIVGDWSIEATCEALGSPPSMGLSIYATKPIMDSSGKPMTNQKGEIKFKLDPVRNLPLDKNHPISALFRPETRLCPEYFKDGDDWPNVIKCKGVGSNTNFSQYFYISSMTISRSGVPVAMYADPYTHRGDGPGSYGLMFTLDGKFYSTLGGADGNMADCIGKSISDLQKAGRTR